MLLRFLFSAALLAVFTVTPGPAPAADFAAPSMASRPAAVAGGADHAAEIARVQTGGRVLDVRPALDNAESAYEVRVLLDEGRVRRIVIDVESGKVQ
jgi:hypothetical protein